MNSRRLFVASVAAAVMTMPASLHAQHSGVVELGGFAQYTHLDEAWHLDNGFGFGGRLGVFLTRRWELEAFGTASSFSNTVSGTGSTSAQTFGGLIDYNLPFGMGGHTHQLLLEAGAGGQRVGGHSDFSVPLGGGLRFNFNDVVGLRFDGIVQYVENPTALSFAPPPTVPGVNVAAARSTNVEIRAGLSFLLGNRKPAPPPPPAPPAPPQKQEQAPPPAPPPPPPPPAPKPNTDSIDAVNRARDALLAKVYFDFDKAALREDQRAVLDSKIPVLQANPTVRIRIEGNADERGSDEYNMALAMRRAQTAKQYLIDHGVDASRMDISSNGEEKPVCQEHNESCWSQNRRDEFVIVAGGDNLVAPR